MKNSILALAVFSVCAIASANTSKPYAVCQSQVVNSEGRARPGKYFGSISEEPRANGSFYEAKIFESSGPAVPVMIFKGVMSHAGNLVLRQNPSPRGGGDTFEWLSGAKLATWTKNVPGMPTARVEFLCQLSN